MGAQTLGGRTKQVLAVLAEFPRELRETREVPGVQSPAMAERKGALQPAEPAEREVVQEWLDPLAHQEIQATQAIQGIREAQEIREVQVVQPALANRELLEVPERQGTLQAEAVVVQQAQAEATRAVL